MKGGGLCLLDLLPLFSYVLYLQALAELCEIKFGKTHPVCSLVIMLLLSFQNSVFLMTG